MRHAGVGGRRCVEPRAFVTSIGPFVKRPGPLKAPVVQSALRLVRKQEVFRMAISRSLALVTYALLSAPALAGAQQASPAPGARDLAIEVSPFVSSGGDSSSVGAAVRWPFAARLGVEFEAEYRHTLARPLSGSLENAIARRSTRTSGDSTPCWTR